MTIKSIIRFLLRDLPRFLLGSLILVAVTLNFANIVGRYFFRKPIPWAEEVLTFMFVWAIFIGVSTIAYERTNLSVDILVGAFSKSMRRIVDYAVVVLTAIICGFAAYQSWVIVQLMLRINSVSLTAKIPIAVPYSAFVLGFTLIALSSIAGAVYREEELEKPGSPTTDKLS